MCRVRDSSTNYSDKLILQHLTSEVSIGIFYRGGLLLGGDLSAQLC